MTKVLQFGQPSSTVHISGSGESRNLFEPALLYFNSYVQDATAQQIGGSFGKMFGFLAVLSKNDGPDEAEVEAYRNQRMCQHLDVFIIRTAILLVGPYPLSNQSYPCGHVFSEKIA